MSTALTIGGARFIGRFTVEELLDAGYDVTLFSRGETPIPFDESTVDHVEGDRTNDDDLRRAAEAVDPDVVVDFAAMKPGQVQVATEIFSDVEAYAYVSSTHAYQRTATIPLREGATPLEPCTPEQAVSDDRAHYGPKKAEGDRVVFEAADRGVNAISVRPTAIYGPYDYTQRQDYWMDRVRRYDRVVVPGDEYRMPIHLGYVEDVARAIRLIVERGEPGEAYNVADRHHLTFDDFIELIARELDTSVEVVHATGRDLAGVGLSVTDFPLCEPYPYLVSTGKLASLGWDSTPFEEGMERAVAEHVESDRVGEAHGPDRETEERLIGSLAGGVTHIDGS